MSRTATQIKEELDKIFPREWSDNAIGNAIVFGIATVLAARESAFDAIGGWLQQMFVSSASGFWLDEHGKDYGETRNAGASDSEYRSRIGWRPKILTAGSAVEELSITMPEGYEVIIEEPFYNTLDDGFFLGDTSSILTNAREENPDPNFLFWVFVPIPEVMPVLDFFLGSSYLGNETYLDETSEDLNRAHIRAIINDAESRRCYGIAWGLTVADIAQPAHFDGLFKARAGGYI